MVEHMLVNHNETNINLKLNVHFSFIIKCGKSCVLLLKRHPKSNSVCSQLFKGFYEDYIASIRCSLCCLLMETVGRRALI